MKNEYCKKLLIIGDINSKFVRDYSESLKESFAVPLLIEIFNTFPTKQEYLNTTRERIWTFPCPNRLKKKKEFLLLLRAIWLTFFLLRRGNKYSHIHVHYVLVDFIWLGWLFYLIKPKIIVSVYGSDFHRASILSRYLLKGLFQNAIAVTFSNNKTASDFDKYYHYHLSSKIRICLFGLFPLDEIKRIKAESIEIIREKLGLPLNKTLICIGYNYSENQQHLKILDVIESDVGFRKYHESVAFLFPLTYGFDEDYRRNIIRRLDSFPFQSIIFPTFLDEKAIALLRLSCDIMIQVQKNDQLSGAMLEHLFSGNVVITGAWLPYDVLDNAGVYIVKIKSLESLSSELAFCIDNLKERKTKSRNNEQIVYELASWKHTIHNWIQLYNLPLS